MPIGAFDASVWAGLVLSDRPGRGFAIRLSVERDGERAEGLDLMHIVHEVGPHAPDGSYARISFDTHLPLGKGHDTPTIARSGRHPGVILEWARFSDAGAVARVRTTYTGRLELTGYFPWDWSGTWLAGDATIDGVTGDRDRACCVRWAQRSSTPDVPMAETVIGPDGLEADVGFTVTGATTVYLATATAPTASGAHDIAQRAMAPDMIDRLLAERATEYANRRVTVDGHWAGLGEAITNNLHWMVLLKPESGRRYTPAGRRWIFPKTGGGKDHWTVFCWDALLNALELAVESPDLARDTLLAVLETQYENGNVPNWRGRYAGTPDRSQPPIGAFAVLKCFLRTRDRALIEHAFPFLERWSAWWRAPKGRGLRRDGNANGLFEWGCDLEHRGHSPAPWENEASHHQRATWESGQDDLPNWDDAQWLGETETLDLESVDLNALLALDLECLATLSHELGEHDKAAAYQARRSALIDVMNELLWDDECGMYVDRFWNGRRSTRLSASNFYPLVAGVPDRRRAERMIETLLEPSKFWGPHVVPTISRDDPAFADQQYWRGTIWPPPNYLIYQGLRRYQFDEVAGELAARSVDLFLRSWRDFQLCRENYDSNTGEGGGHAYQSWGPLFALIGLEECIDVTPWDGLRLGTLAPPPRTTVHNLELLDRRWTVTTGETGLEVVVDGTALLRTDGPATFRHVELSPESLRAKVLSLDRVSVSVPGMPHDAMVTVDGEVNATSTPPVRLPGGHHDLHVCPRSRT
jgi:glycogen debranching enzyme